MGCSASVEASGTNPAPGQRLAASNEPQPMPKSGPSQQQQQMPAEKPVPSAPKPAPNPATQPGAQQMGGADDDRDSFETAEHMV